MDRLQGLVGLLSWPPLSATPAPIPPAMTNPPMTSVVVLKPVVFSSPI